MKSYLFDTHALLWLVSDPKQLSKKVIEIYEDGDNQLYFSYMSIWEISIKMSTGKLRIDCPLEQFVEELENKGFILSMPTIADALEISMMPFYKNLGTEHRDPFDRILIVQSKNLEVEIVSIDEKFDLYPNIRRIW